MSMLDYITALASQDNDALKKAVDSLVAQGKRFEMVRAKGAGEHYVLFDVEKHEFTCTKIDDDTHKFLCSCGKSNTEEHNYRLENDKFIYQLWHHRGQCELAHDWTMGWCSKEGGSLIFKCERKRIGCILRT